MEIYVAHTQGFCAGVARAIKIVDQVLEQYGTPLYVFHEIVHNKSVVRNFEKKGVTFVEDLDDVPSGARLIFSAHGVAPSVIEKAKEKKLHFVDATCPLVSRVHQQAEKFSQKGIPVVLIGHKKHQEVVGTQGYVEPKLFHLVENETDVDALTINPEKEVGYVAQTTLSLDETQGLVKKLRNKFPNLIVQKPIDICYATQNRQDAIKELCKVCEIILVCGSANSSNSNRLKETAEALGIKSFLIDCAEELDLGVLKGKNIVGISSGASVPSFIVEEVMAKIQKNFTVTKIHVPESTEKEIVFALPVL